MEGEMLHQVKSRMRRYLRNTTFLVVFGCVTVSANGQQFEDPVLAEAYQDEAAEQVRIVDGRPKLYSFKRIFHPITLVDFTVKPILRLAESQASKFGAND